MARSLIRMILLLAFPMLILIIGGGLMMHIAEQDRVEQQLNEKAQVEDRLPLNRRWTGYDLDAVKRYWGALDARAMQAEKSFLQMDLAFPVFYGMALAVSLWLAVRNADRSRSHRWVFAPVALTVIADWTENIVQLAQMERFQVSGIDAVEANWIQVASIATMVKLVLFSVSILMIAWLSLVNVFNSGRLRMS